MRPFYVRSCIQTFAFYYGVIVTNSCHDITQMQLGTYDNIIMYIVFITLTQEDCHSHDSPAPVMTLGGICATYIHNSSKM